MTQLAADHIGTVEIGNALGIGVHQDSMLCNDKVLEVDHVDGSITWYKSGTARANRINKWSLAKSVVRATPIGPLDINNSGSFFRYNATTGDRGGLLFPDIVDANTLNAVFVKVDSGEDVFIYNPPTGGASSPYRKDDFRLYTKDKPECSLNVNSNIDSVKTWTYDNATHAVGISYTNWDTLHILQVLGGLKFYDIWFDETGTLKLSDYYFTVFVKTYAGNWYVKSLFRMSDKITINNYSEINELLNFDTIYTMPRSWQTVERRYLLTRINVDMLNPQFYSTELSGALSDLNNITGYHIPISPACYMPIIKPTLHSSFYVNNSINFSLYQLLTVINNTANTYSLKIGHLLSTDYDYDNTDWMKNSQGVIESYTVGQGVYEEITVGINKLFVNKFYKVIMTLSANDDPILHLYKNGVRVSSGTWDALGVQIYGDVTGYMWRWGGTSGVQVTTGSTLGGEDALTLYVGTPKHYLTVHAEAGSNTGFILDVNFENPDFSDISNHVIDGGGSFRFEIPADDTIIGLYAEFTGNYAGQGAEDTNLSVTLVGSSSTSVTLEVKPTDPLGTTEHTITISGTMV